MTDETLMTASTDSTAASEQEATKDVAAEAVSEGEAKDVQADGDAQAEEADQSADEAKDGEAEKDEKEDDEPQGAPEAYEDFTVPDGVELDTEVLGDFQALGKELNLPQAEAQKVVDLGTKMAQKWADQQTENILALRTEWADATKADKEIGGDALPQNLAVAKKAMDTFGSPALRELLDQSGLGNHPEVIRFFVKTGKTISEDTLVSSRQDGPAKAGAAKTLFPDQN